METLNHKLRVLLNHLRRNTECFETEKRAEIDELVIKLLKEEDEKTLENNE
jgi:hypothetical protein